MIPIQPLRHIYNNPSLDREEYEYLKHLIRKENENAQRANGCTY